MNDVNERIVDERVVVLAPTVMDAALSRSILTEAGMTCHLCTDLCDLCRTFDAGAGAILLTEEMLGERESHRLVEAVQGQPDWSEVPVLLLSTNGADSPESVKAMELLGNVTVLERPVRVTTLVSALRTVLKARRRQYELRDQLKELQASEERLASELAATARLHALSSRLLAAEDLIAALDDVLENAIATCGADFGNIQLYKPQTKTLEIIVERGFRHDFLDHFRMVRADGGSACAQAVQSGERIVVEDVEFDPEFEPHRRIAAAAGFRAVQSTPLRAHGKILGMLSVHFRAPHRVSEREQRLLDLYARHAADLIERKEAEAALRFHSQQFETLLNRSPLGVYLVDADFRITQVNPVAARAFASIPNIIGRDFDEVIHILWTKEYADEIVAIFRHTLQNGESFIMPERAEFNTARGLMEYYEWRVDRIVLPDGRFGAVCYFRDISEQVKARLALKELDQRKDEFIANMSHELRSPLAGIMGYADILLTRVKDPFDTQCLKTIKESGNYLVEIVNDILDLAKIEAGKLVLNFEPFSPHAVFGEIHGLMDVRAREKELLLVLRFDGVLPASIETDRTRLRQILINLVSNAIKFTQQGRVEIVARFLSEENLLHVEVTDTGIGIAPEHQETLFQPFTQADTTSTRQYGGTGLGLPITKRLVEMLGGSISLESELGKGSTFCVTILTRPDKSVSNRAGTRSNSGPLPESETLGNRHILVVDDMQNMCKLLSWYIENAGGRPRIATSGRAAVQEVERAASSDPFDAVILDIQMPGMDGYEVLRMLRAKGVRLPVIAVTAGAMVTDREKCMQAGFDDHLTKPIDGRRLVQVLAARTQPR